MRVEFTQVGFKYGQDTSLHSVNLALQPGTLTVLCGQTGSGKSTLLQIASGLEQPTEGSVSYLAGVKARSPQHAAATDAAYLQIKAARSRIGIVFQMPEAQLFAGTVREDVEYGLKLRKVPGANRLPLVEKALRSVGLEPSEFLERSPFLLSGGQKRRVAIAGALALAPEFLILDEPTAGLDPEAAASIRDILRELRDTGITILVATHDLDLFFPVADQVLVLRQGELTYAGEARNLLRNEEILREAGLELPAAASIANRLRKLGLTVDTALSAEELLPALDSLPAATTEGMQPPSSEGIQSASSAGMRTPGNVISQGEAYSSNNPEAPSHFYKQGASLLERLDPRAKWLGLVLLAVSILSVTTLWGLLAGAVVSFAIIRLGRITLRRVLKLVRPILPMFLFIWAVGAVSFGQADLSLGPIGIDYQGAARGGLGVGRFFLVMILGIAFSDSTSGAPLREGLEWAIRPLRKLRIPTRDISLAVTIAVQFLPLVLERFWQLRKAVRSRGQDTIGIRRFSPAQLTVLLVPLLISLLKMGDELATAIESRGYSREAERTSWYELCWSSKDTAACLLTIAAAGLLSLG